MGSCLPCTAGGMQRIPTLRSTDMVVLRRKLRKKMAQLTYTHARVTNDSNSEASWIPWASNCSSRQCL